MSDFVIETRALRKEFRNRRGEPRVAVHDLALAVPAGGVHGFLGPNGAGKSTTIRMLLGLARPTRGTMRLLGQPVPERLPQVIGRVGAVVESPKFSPTFSGRRNLQLLAGVIGVPDIRVDAVIETVKLAGRETDRFKAYSLGMKQRLAIAATLLKGPDLLILDEPTNGLDPAGIREIRETIRDLGDAGVTVLLSSHILAEVQQVCTSATIIGNGKLLATGAVDELLGSGRSYRVATPDAAAAAAVLTRAGLTPAHVDGALQVETDRPETIAKILGESGVLFTELSPVRADLESYFLQLTQAEELGRDTTGDPQVTP